LNRRKWSRLQSDKHPLYRFAMGLVNEVMGSSAWRFLGLLTKPLKQRVIDKLHRKSSHSDIAATTGEPFVAA